MITASRRLRSAIQEDKTDIPEITEPNDNAQDDLEESEAISERVRYVLDVFGRDQQQSREI